MKLSELGYGHPIYQKYKNDDPTWLDDIQEFL
jgi:hypothetical protein